MITLGLDPSLTGFGWAIHDSNAEGPSRLIERGLFKTTPRELFVHRYMYLRRSVFELLRDRPAVENVAVESPPYGALFSEGLYGLYLYVNEALVLARKDVVFFDPQTLKMLVKVDPKVRKGKMSKSDMIQAAKDDTGIRKWNHNEADAYHVARFGSRFFSYYAGGIGQDQLTPAEIQSFSREKTYKKGKKAGLTEKLGLIFREQDRFFLYSQIKG